MTLKKKVIQLVEERDHGCVFCGSPDTHLHHITYRSRGGVDEDWNLISLCARHHEWVHKVNFPEWVLHLCARAGVPVPIMKHGMDTWSSEARRGIPGKLRDLVICCLSCDRRDGAGVCELWEHHVDWNYVCDNWVSLPWPALPPRP